MIKRKCIRCSTQMVKGVVLVPTDFVSWISGGTCTQHTISDGRLNTCLKCPKCAYTVVKAKRKVITRTGD